MICLYKGERLSGTFRNEGYLSLIFDLIYLYPAFPVPTQMPKAAYGDRATKLQRRRNKTYVKYIKTLYINVIHYTKIHYKSIMKRTQNTLKQQREELREERRGIAMNRHK